MEHAIRELETVFANICVKAYPHEWDENHLSFTLMREFRRLFENRRIHYTGFSKIVAWRSFKNRGKMETQYGDIALIVNIQFSSGEYLRGVANLEAKRSFPSGKFGSVELKQLETINNNLPYAHLLFYSHHAEMLLLKFPYERDYHSYMYVSPVNTARQIFEQTNPDFDWKILRTSLPFSQYLFSRIFWGLDLDFRDDIRQDLINGYNRIISPSFLGVVDIHYDDQSPVEIALSDIWEPID